MGRLEGKRPLGRSRPTLEDNIKMNLREVDCGAGDWIDLTKDRDKWPAYTTDVMNFRVPLKLIS